MVSQHDVLSELVQLVGADIVVAPDAQNIVRHTSDFGVRGDPAVGILALTYPRDTQQVAAILRYCNQRRIAVQPQGGMTGLVGGAVPVALRRGVHGAHARHPGDRQRLGHHDGGGRRRDGGGAAGRRRRRPVLPIGPWGSRLMPDRRQPVDQRRRQPRAALWHGARAGAGPGSGACRWHGHQRASKVIKNNTGYDLRQLFIGSEGTLGIITAVVLRLFVKAHHISTGICAVDHYRGVLDLLQRARTGLWAATDRV